VIHPNIADALKAPDLVRLTDGLVLLRFESMKIYSALAAVRRLLDRGTVRPGQTLIDSSSGIYAYALALACHRYGMRCHIVASTTVDATTRAQLEILGATVEQVEPSRNLKLDQELRVRRVHEILAERPDCHWMRQYHDDIHCLGYHEVADRITAAFPHSPLTVVGGVGSGASTGGLVERLRATDPSVRLVGVQPFGSVTFGSQDHHDPEAIIAGIGSSIVFDNVRHHLYDTVHWMDFTHAMSGAVSLLREHAVFAGLSTGAGYLAGTYEARAVLAWTLGGLGGVDWGTLWLPGLATLLGVGVLMVQARNLNLLLAGEEAATTMGLDVARFRARMFVLVSLVTGVLVAAAGPIGFVGLMLPHIVRLFVGGDHRRVLPAAALGGAVFLVWADIAARTIAAPMEIPVGVLTALCGGPFFLWLMRRDARRSTRRGVG
jgi:cysteine synthase A